MSAPWLVNEVTIFHRFHATSQWSYLGGLQTDVTHEISIKSLLSIAEADRKRFRQLVKDAGPQADTDEPQAEEELQVDDEPPCELVEFLSRCSHCLPVSRLQGWSSACGCHGH